MRISLITPAPPTSRAGNRTTASRWANILRALGHRVDIAVDYTNTPADLMIALHAWRSAGSIQRFRERFPGKPLIVALTGTDAYRFIHSHRETTLQSIELADHLVGLHALISNTIPEKYRHKVHVIYQSAKEIKKRQPVKRHFRLCVAGHLRDEKDPLRPAMAIRNLPTDSKIELHHYGKAHTSEWSELAKEEMSANPRYHWFNEVPHYQLRKAFVKSHLLILPSRMEGGANVISEAVMANLPVIASKIEGSTGLLGEDYPGYFPPENEAALCEILYRAENEKPFYKSLEKACRCRKKLFGPQAEHNGWKRLIQQLS